MKRRLFLEKVSLAAGIIAVPNIGWSSQLLEKDSKSKFIFHIGENSTQFKQVLEKVGGFNRSMVFLTDATEFDFSSGLNLDAALYKKDLNLTLKEVEEVLWVNSMIEDRPDYVKEYLINQRLGKKVGILGLDFESQFESFLEVIERLDLKASFLKENQQCDQVFCLINIPENRKGEIALEKLARFSSAIDFFFVERADFPSNNLMALPNKDGRQVMLSINTKNDICCSNIEYVKNSIVSFISE